MNELWSFESSVLVGLVCFWGFFQEKGGWVGWQHAGKSTNGLKATLES